MPPLKAQLLLAESLAAYFPEMVFTDSGITVQLHRNTHLSIMSPYTLAGAVKDLFGLKLGDFPKLKDQLNSLVRNGLIHVDAERISHRNRRSLPECELTTLFNATLLLAIFPDPAMVKSIFVNAEARRKAATFADLIVMNRQSLLELVHLNVNAATFVNVLATPDIDLRKNKLDNPFEVLPQALLEGNVELLSCNVARSASPGRDREHFVKN